jgi:PPOX class probable F420-dependent enzyme
MDALARELLEAPNIVHLATLLPDGSPHSVAIWAGMEGDRVCFFTQSHSRKARNLAADPRVAISVVDRDNPYRTAYLRGRVVERLEGEEALTIVDRVSVSYTGKPFALRESSVVYLVEPSLTGSMELPFTPAG